MPRQRHYRNSEQRGGDVFITTAVLDFMPEHVHLVLNLPEHESAGVFTGRLKSLVAREIVPHLTLDQQAKFAQQIGLNRRTLWHRSFRSYHLTSDRPLPAKDRLHPQQAGAKRTMLVCEDYPMVEHENVRGRALWRRSEGLSASSGGHAAVTPSCPKIASTPRGGGIKSISVTGPPITIHPPHEDVFPRGAR
jgi:REP element-mobilizing transposase RayT